MSAPAAPPPSALGPALVLFNGPLFIGSLFNWALFGTVTLQVYMYYKAGFRDSNWIRGLVGTVYILDIVQTVFATHCVWYMVVWHWGDAAVLLAPPWTSTTFPVMSGLIAVLVQIFFAWRIWILKKHWLARSTSVFILLVALMQCISGVVFGIRSAFTNILDMDALHPGIIVWLGGAFACDVLIVAAMLFILHSARTPVGFERTNNIIDRLMIQTVHSGAVTAVAALAELVLFLVAPGNLMHSCIVIFLGKLYSNVLLANLNGRQKHDSSYGASTSDSNGTLGGRVNTTSRMTGGTDSRNAPYVASHGTYNTDNIQIKTYKHVHVDETKSGMV